MRLLRESYFLTSFSLSVLGFLALRPDVGSSVCIFALNGCILGVFDSTADM